MTKLMIAKQTNPYHNLAAEEAIYSHLEDDVIFLWQNEPSVIIGKNQNPLAEVNIDYAKMQNIRIARRLTGGGAVYQDMGNINVSYIFNCNGPEQSFDDKVGHFLDLFIAYLQSRGVQPILTGRNDICVRDAEGNLRKISGTAMTQKENCGIFHLCLLFDADMHQMERVLTPSAEKLASKGVASVRSRTINIKALHPQFKDWTNNAFFDDICGYFLCHAEAAEIPETLSSSIADLEKNRYERKQWIYDRKY